MELKTIVLINTITLIILGVTNILQTKNINALAERVIQIEKLLTNPL